MPKIIVVMGVSGSGKSSVGRALAAALACPFLEGDAVHPPANVEKMRQGTPLEDADRWPWLDRIAEWIAANGAAGGVVACSALRRSYRERLRRADSGLRFVHLDVPAAELLRRMEQRRHFMPASLLHSQLETLESPGVEECALTVDATQAQEAIVAQTRSWLESGNTAATGR